jgi:Integron cassette protein VCH_CASS1 chain
MYRRWRRGRDGGLRGDHRKGIEELHTYAEGMGRADHHAGKVKGIALALLGGIIWRAEPDSIRTRRFDGSPANMLWVKIGGNTYVFAYNHQTEKSKCGIAPKPEHPAQF